MVTVTFSATVVNEDTEETFTGWVDPDWNMWELRTNADDVRSWIFETAADAMEFVDSRIGSVDLVNVSRGTYYAEDAQMNTETGEVWSYAAHVE